MSKFCDIKYSQNVGCSESKILENFAFSEPFTNPIEEAPKRVATVTAQVRLDNPKMIENFSKPVSELPFASYGCIIL
jgi:hypothetical protein